MSLDVEANKKDKGERPAPPGGGGRPTYRIKLRWTPRDRCDPEQSMQRNTP